HLLPADRTVAPGGRVGVPARVRDSLHRASRREAEAIPADVPRLRTHQPGRDLARALSGGGAVDQWRRGPGDRGSRDRRDPVLRGAVPPVHGLVRRALSDDLAEAGGGYAGARAALARTYMHRERIP